MISVNKNPLGKSPIDIGEKLSFLPQNHPLGLPDNYPSKSSYKIQNRKEPSFLHQNTRFSILKTYVKRFGSSSDHKHTHGHTDRHDNFRAPSNRLSLSLSQKYQFFTKFGELIKKDS